MKTEKLHKIREALDFSLLQWKMYSDIQNGTNENLETTDHKEGELYRRCKEALAILDALEKESKWQPIETAPTDGSSFLIIRKGAKRHHHRVVFYSGISYRKPFKTYHGTYTDGLCWMPLPPPPSEDA